MDRPPLCHRTTQYPVTLSHQIVHLIFTPQRFLDTHTTECRPRTVLNEVSTLTVKSTLLTLSSFWRFDRFCSCSFNKEWIRPSCWLWHRLSFRWNHGKIYDVANLNKLQLTTFNLIFWKILSRFLGIWYRFIPAVPTRVLSFKLRIPSQMLISSLILGTEPTVEVRNDYSWGKCGTVDRLPTTNVRTDHSRSYLNIPDTLKRSHFMQIERTLEINWTLISCNHQYKKDFLAVIRSSHWATLAAQ